MLWLLCSLALSQSPTAAELVGLTRVGSPALSPDGQRLVFVETRRSFDPEAGPDSETEAGWTTESVLVELDLESGTTRDLSWGEGVDVSGPRWSPDGAWIGYRRSEGDDSSLVLLPAAGGEPRPIDTGDLDPGGWDFAGSDAIAFTATPELDEETEAERFARGGAFRHDARFRNARLYTLPTAGGEAVAITDGSAHVTDFAWSEEAGSWLLHTTPSSDPYLTLVASSYSLLRDGQTTALESEPDCPGDFAWSPDGTRAAWVVCEGTRSIPNRVMVHEIGGETRQVLDDLDRTIDRVDFADPNTLVLLTTARTRTGEVRIDLRSGRLTVDSVADGVQWGPIELGRKGERYTLATEPDRLPRLQRIDKKGRATDLYDPNPDAREWELGEVELFEWTNSEGTALDGLLTRPPGADGKTPLLVLPHGGPDGVSQEGFDSWARFFSARGYAVFRPNYRGGVGYGVDHYAANRGRLGEIELIDIESGVDALIEAGLADGDRLFYGGWSWGGYLTAWTIGNTDRYKAAVAGAAVVDTVAQYVTSDINHGAIAEWEYTTRPWKGLERYDAADPSRRLGNVATPTLVLHGDADRRVPFSQGLTLYRALVDLGVETELWVYPGAPHGIGDPGQRIHRLNAWIAWYDQHGGRIAR